MMAACESFAGFPIGGGSNESPIVNPSNPFATLESRPRATLVYRAAYRGLAGRPRSFILAVVT